MDDFDYSKNADKEEPEQLIPFDDSEKKNDTNVSHSPLTLGGGTSESSKIGFEKPSEEKAGEKIVSSERITGTKTFFTKLHAGSIDYLDEQINKWLKDNPGIKIKSTNTVTGDVVGKKTEPNIVVTIWY